jgi:hypothetical protein
MIGIGEGKQRDRKKNEREMNEENNPGNLS